MTIGTRSLTLAALVAVGCLPEDTRPPPATVTVNFRAGEATARGFDTLDGWHVRFERFVVSIGGGDLDGDACTSYGGGDYFRLLDGLNATPQKLGLAYALGTCAFEVRVRNPELDSLLGAGITEADKTAMRDPGSDAHEQNAGMTFWVRGVAERASARKSFEWKYRRRRVGYQDCVIDGVDTFTLVGNQEKTVEVRVHGEGLFQDHPEPEKARLRFDPIAAADADGDGAVTLEELDKVPMASSGIDLSGVEGSDRVKTLGDFVYDGLFPQVIRVGEKGSCKLRRGPRND